MFTSMLVSELKSSHMPFHHFRYCLAMMSWVGVNPLSTGRLQQFVFSLILFVNITLIFSLFLHLNEETQPDITDLSPPVEMLILIFHGTLKLVALRAKKKEILRLLHATEKLWDLEKIKNRRVKGKIRTIVRILEYLRNTFYAYVAVTLLAFVFPVFQGKFIFDTYNFGAFFVISSQVIMFPLGLAVPVLIHDVFYCTLVFLIYLQFRALNWRTYAFRRPSGVANVLIKRWVRHHNRLLKLVDDVNETFSVPVLLYFGIITFTFCVELFVLRYQKNLKDLLRVLFYLGGAVFQFALYCVPGEILTYEADKVGYNCYSMDWCDHYNPSMRFALRMAIMRSNKSVRVKVGNILMLGMKTCASTIKSSITYCMFLWTMSDIQYAKRK